MQPLVFQWAPDRLGLQQPMLLSPLRPLDMDPGVHRDTDSNATWSNESTGDGSMN